MNPNPEARCSSIQLSPDIQSWAKQEKTSVCYENSQVTRNEELNRHTKKSPRYCEEIF